MNSTNMKTRITYFDNIKGILIILVVFAHFLFNLQSSDSIHTIVTVIYSFHMPAFLFISGYFSKNASSKSHEQLLKLLSAYLLLHSFFIFFYLSSANSTKLLSAYHSEWYVLFLIICRLLIPYISKYNRILCLSVLLSILIGFFPETGGNEILAINKIVTFLPFFIAGYLTRAETLEKMRSFSFFREAMVIVLTILASVITILIGIKYLHIETRALLAFAYQSVTLSEPVARVSMFVVSVMVIVLLLIITSDRKMYILTKAGKHSLSIFLLHRPITLIAESFLKQYSSAVQILISGILTVLVVIVFGSDIVNNFVNSVLDRSVAVICKKQGDKYQNLFRTAFCTILISTIIFPVFISLMMNREDLLIGLTPANDKSALVMDRNTKTNATVETDPILRIMSKEEQDKFEDAYRIVFAGDLILLEDQVRNAYTGNGYDFSDCFEYTRSYISDADFAIGVFEGPMGGTVRNYSSSNYDDGKELYLNFPDEWCVAVKDAGFDLVTTANNHALDMGVDGLRRTIDILKENGLDHTGTYKDYDDKERNHIKVVEKDGLRIAILSYTLFVNNVGEDQLIDGELSFATSMIVEEQSEYFEEIKKSVASDFMKAKELSPDIIMVLPHWGTQFSDYPDETQILWEGLFKEYGADVILGDHTHSVQPVSIEDGMFSLYCPGNYANVYRDYNGDCSALVEVYIDRSSKEVIGGSIIPMWVTAPANGNYRPIPIYDIMTEPDIGRQITTYDMERVEEAQKHITKVMLGVELDLNMVQKRCYFDDQGFMRTMAPMITPNEDMMKSNSFLALKSGGRVCFIGDSVTVGTKNGGVPWYEPLEYLIEGDIINCGWGGVTTKQLLNEYIDQILEANADLYVIAIGTNDVRYRNADCAMTSDEYVENLSTLRERILEKNKDAKFVFISPWTSTDGDRVSVISYNEKQALNSEYAERLRSWAKDTGDVFVDANKYIEEVLSRYPVKRFLLDYIHPNATKGVQLYSEAFLRG